MIIDLTNATGLTPATGAVLGVLRSSTLRHTPRPDPLPIATEWRVLATGTATAPATISPTVAARLDQLNRLVACATGPETLTGASADARGILVGWLWRCHQYGLIGAVERDALTAVLRGVSTDAAA